MLGGEVQQVRRARARERVDRLGRVAHHADVVATTDPQVEQRRLERADVLELVDHEPAVLPADLGRDPLVLGQQRGRAQQHVLHVHPALAALDVLVRREHPGHGRGVLAGDRPAARGGDPGVVVGADVADLGPLDLAGQVAQRGLVGADPVAAGGVAHQAELGVEQRGQLTAVHLGPEEARLPQRRGVEGPGLHRAGPEPPQPGAHLAGGPGREGHREHLGGVVDPGRDAVGDPVGDRPGLAGAGTREHPDRPLERHRDGPLLGVQRRQQLVGSGRRGRVHRGTFSSDRVLRRGRARPVVEPARSIQRRREEGQS